MASHSALHLPNEESDTLVGNLWEFDALDTLVENLQVYLSYH
jgi:hypothetical protein